MNVPATEERVAVRLTLTLVALAVALAWIGAAWRIARSRAWPGSMSGWARRRAGASLLKESFAQLLDYERGGWARRFFENCRASLKWQRLKPYEKLVEMIERHWDGIAAYCKTENKVSLGFVEGLNNKIRVIQRRAYGLRDEDYLRLIVLTCMLPKL